MTGAPEPGNRILVLQEKWLRKIFADEKTLEIRHQRLSSGVWCIGTGSEIWGFVELGEAIRITSLSQWEELLPKHRWSGLTTLPYKSTCGLPILSHHQFEAVVPYKHARGSIGTAMYQPLIPITIPKEIGGGQSRHTGGIISKRPATSADAPAGEDEDMPSMESFVLAAANRLRGAADGIAAEIVEAYISQCCNAIHAARADAHGTDVDLHDGDWRVFLFHLNRRPGIDFHNWANQMLAEFRAEGRLITLPEYVAKRSAANESSVAIEAPTKPDQPALRRRLRGKQPAPAEYRPVKRRPARMRLRLCGRDRQTLCSGFAGNERIVARACTFGKDGERARGKHAGRCALCNADKFQATCQNARARKVITLAIRAAVTNQRPTDAEFISLRLRHEIGAAAADALVEHARAGQVRTAAGDRAARSAAAKASDWSIALARRRKLRAAATRDAAAEYREKVEADRRWVQNKFFPVRQKRVKTCNYPHASADKGVVNCCSYVRVQS